jgi:hypothetical protein
MPTTRFALILLCLIAAAQAHAADESKEKEKGSNKIERTAEKAGAALGRTANRAERGVMKGVAATEKAINTAGRKTGQWFNEKTK